MSGYQNFARFYHDTADRIYKLGFLLVGQGGEDLAAEAFARALANWTTVEGTKHPEAWVRRVTINLSISLLRRRSREQAFIRTKRVAESSPAIAHEERLAVEQALERLSPKQRAAIVLRYYEDYSVRDIARALKCTSSSADTHLRRGLERLGVELAPEYGHSKQHTSRRSKKMH